MLEAQEKEEEDHIMRISEAQSPELQRPRLDIDIAVPENMNPKDQ